MLNFDTKVIFRNIDAEIEKQIEELEQQAQQCYYNNDYPQTLEYLDKIPIFNLRFLFIFFLIYNIRYVS